MKKSETTAFAIKKLTTISLLLIATGFLLSATVSPAMAAPPDCSVEISKRCHNTGDGDDSGSFAAKFCLGISDRSPGLEGDGSGSDLGDYCGRNKIDKLLVFTGKGPGFRFDTNKGKSTAVRHVQINFDGIISVDDADNVPHTYYSGLYEIDFRFDVDSGGLALESLAEIDDSGVVPIGIKIQSLDGNDLGLLGYGNAASLFSDPSLDTACMASDTKDAVVTRIAGDAWTIESDPSDLDACLWVGHSNFAGQDGTVIEMPFYFTIVIDP